jgi:hypothetical protein
MMVGQGAVYRAGSPVTLIILKGGRAQKRELRIVRGERREKGNAQIVLRCGSGFYGRFIFFTGLERGRGKGKRKL